MRNVNYESRGKQRSGNAKSVTVGYRALLAERPDYRGRIWVDAADFAVVRLEAEPAKNPSFWTKKAEIVQIYKKVSDFWLPAYNYSVTGILFELGVQADEYALYLHKGTLTAHLSPLARNVFRYAIQLKQAGLRRA